MESVLSRLERRFGRFAITNLTTYIVVGMALTFVLGVVKPGFASAMQLDFAAVRAGQLWRLVSYLFIPRDSGIIWVVFQLSFTWFIGRSLEAEWGAFKLNVFYLVGMLGTTLAAFISGEPVANFYLNTSLFLAFATLFPDQQLTLYLIIPVKVKWLGFLSAALLAVEAVLGTWGQRAGIVAAMANYFLFFGPHLVGLARARQRVTGQAGRMAAINEGRSSGASKASDKPLSRACSACGALESDGADIRVCSCEKCGIPTLFCVEHARSH